MANRKKSYVKLFSLWGLYEAKRVMLSWTGAEKFCQFLEEKTPIRPNHITVFNWLIGILAFYLLFRSHWGFVVVILIHYLLDNLDGYYARIRGLSSKLGEYLDHVGDIVFGELFMLKTYLFLGDWWIILGMITFILEAIIVYRIGLAKDKFPSRIFVDFYIFGFYKLGIWVQVIYQPLAFVAFLLIHNAIKSREMGSFELDEA